MVSQRCKSTVRDILKKLGLHCTEVALGSADIQEQIDDYQKTTLKTELLQCGLELLDNKKAILAERVKGLILEMVHGSKDITDINYSKYISHYLGYNYTYISNVFSEVLGTSITQYIILNKIERVKELLLYNELNLTDISYQLGYSSVAHLSNQFKKTTGVTPSCFKHLKCNNRIALDDLLIG